MMYFEKNQPHILFWPVIAIGWEESFWIGIGWLNMEIGWKAND